jgi:hypothetical protein
MTELVATLPDELAQRAKDAGLLSDSAIRQLLEDAMRRDAGRKLLVIADRVRATGVAPMSMEEDQRRGQGRARCAPGWELPD